jgi:hypothetical protein
VDTALALPDLEAALQQHHAAARSWERREVQGLRSDWRDLRADYARQLLDQDRTWHKADISRWLDDRMDADEQCGTAAEELAELPVAGLAVHLRTLRRRLAAARSAPDRTARIPATGRSRSAPQQEGERS